MREHMDLTSKISRFNNHMTAISHAVDMPTIQMYSTKMARLRLMHSRKKTFAPPPTPGTLRLLPPISPFCVGSTASPNVPFNTEIVPHYPDLQRSLSSVSIDDVRHGNIDGADNRHRVNPHHKTRNSNRKLHDGDDSETEGVRESRGKRAPAPTRSSFKGGGPGGSRNSLNQPASNSSHHIQHNSHIHSHTVGVNSSLKQPDDLVAMGTLWQPPPNTSSNNTSRGPGNGRPVNNATSSSLQTQHRKVPSRSSVVPHPHVSSRHKEREVEPKYPDPMIASFPSFQQRLSELSMLEADTIRYERTKKFKKKPKDKES